MTAIGFVGLPGCGKSTVFHALTRQAVPKQFLSFDLKPHQAVVKIPDTRLDKLVELHKSKSVVPAAIEFVDIPGFDPGSTEQKLKTAVLEHYRRCDALVLVVELFHPDTAAKATSGMRAVMDELVLLDLISAERTAGNLEKSARLKGDKEQLARYELLCRVKAQLENNVPLRSMELEPDEAKQFRDLAFLSAKPVIVLFNIADEDYAKPVGEIPGLAEAEQLAESWGLEHLRFSASLEAALVELEAAEAAEYMAEFGVTEPALPRFIRAAYGCLGLITYLTSSEKESRAWLLRRGSNAQQAAGVIHSDLARGFIRAETIAYGDLVQYGSLSAAKAAGKVRLEGKEYIVADGDVLLIRFNV